MYINVDPYILLESGEYQTLSLTTQAETVMLNDGTTVQQNLGGILDILKNVVGEPDG